MWTLLSLFISCLQLYLINAYEFTFELPDNKKNCYFRLIDKGTESKFEFQVISGGNYDVDLTINGPGERGKELVLFSLRQKQFESFKWISNISGEYSACFNNEFSSFSHKIIYFDWVSGEEETFGGKHPGPVNHPLTMMESASETIHDNLNEITEHQTHYKLSEASGRIFGEELNNRVTVLSLSETLAILIIGVGQIVVLRNFFTDKQGGR